MTETIHAAESPAVPPEFPIARGCPFAPPDEYRRIREEQPITKVRLPDGREAWALSRLADVRALLTDHRFSANRRDPRFPALTAGGAIRLPVDERSILTLDAPEHGPARRAVLGEFTVRRMEALRPRIQQIVDEHIDAMLAGPLHHGKRSADLVQALSLPVPSLVICELLGVPYEDHEYFQRHSAKTLDQAIGPEERQASVDAIIAYLDELITAKEASPGDDLFGRQIVKRREEGTYRHSAMVALAFLLLIAGHETTANMISLGALMLMENPDQLAAIRSDPGKTLDAVEEMLRYFTIVDTFVARFCVEDAEIGGVTIRAGEGVLALGHIANRDPEHFADPETFDIERGARHHVAFGFGFHQCLGQNLARLELQIVFDTLFHRIPELKPAAGVDDLPFKDDASIYGLHRLPVTW
ncbi:cytochrome P450 [Amycolatopsis sp. NPDC058986]|uniref:cytochrome P450 n=1 Tax=unclassified Amycolatopsis TaxID=2618356 RepID=UPI0036729244